MHLHIGFASSYPIYLLFSALNHNGYDLEGNPSLHPIRLWVREELGNVPKDDYWSYALPGWPKVHWLTSTLFCLNDKLDFVTNPERIWDDLEWESPEPIDRTERTWLRELSHKLREWSQHLRVQDVWLEYQHRIYEIEPLHLRQQVSDLVVGRLRNTPFHKDLAVVVHPNYLQSNWSVDPLRSGDTLHIVVGPLSHNTAGGIVHEILHEYFSPLLVPARSELSLFLEAVKMGKERLKQWGYWHQDDDNKTVYKVVGESCVQAAYAVLNQEEPYTEWGERGLYLAENIYERFKEQGFFRSTDEIVTFLLEHGI